METKSGKSGIAARIGAKNWVIIILLGLSGQIAWNVENSWFNTFVFDKITTNPGPIAWMVACSAVVATLTTIIMGTFSDRVGRRKPFILVGYVLWGISTVLFPTVAYIRVAGLAVFMVVILDSVMTFFGSTANDSAFNAWTTDISDQTNRGRLSSILSILPALAAVISTALSGALIDRFGYFTFFYALGAIVSVVGLIGGILLKDTRSIRRNTQEEGSLFRQIISIFNKKTIKQNRELFLLFLSMALLMAAYQIHTPYEIIYINNYLNISKTLYGTIAIVPIIALVIFSLIAGKMVDKGYSLQLLLIAVFARFIGLMAFSFVRNIFLVAAAMTVYYAALFIFLVSFTAWTKNLMPEESRGAFEGIRMIFNVALPMMIGPAIGSMLISNFGIPIAQNGSNGFIPTPVLFQVSAFASLFALIPILFIIKDKRSIARGETVNE
jgi:Na+/melibiose symporter and related transporters